MNRYFVIGTDTDCGKTYVTTKLAHAVPHAAAIKPVASGCFMSDNQWISADAQQLQTASSLSLDIINPWRFKSPVSPHIAAREEGIELTAAAIAEYCLHLQLEGVEQLFIEGAGGLMVPLNEQETWIDFLKITGFPVVLVVGMKLGCINHALLTEAVLEQHKIKCSGWIANNIDPHMRSVAENMETLQNKLNAPLLATVPFGGDLSSCCFDDFPIR